MANLVLSAFICHLLFKAVPLLTALVISCPKEETFESHLVKSPVLPLTNFLLLFIKKFLIVISSLGVGFIIALPAGFETGTVNTLIYASQVKMRSPNSLTIQQFLSYPNIGSYNPKFPGINWNGAWAIRSEKRI